MTDIEINLDVDILNEIHSVDATVSEPLDVLVTFTDLQSLPGVLGPQGPAGADGADGAAVGSATPLMDGVASVGVSPDASHEDHVHPSDTSKANLSHAHAQSDVTGLAASLSAKADTSHTHAESDITNLVTDLSGKASTVHSHAQSDITGLATALGDLAPKDSPTFTTLVNFSFLTSGRVPYATTSGQLVDVAGFTFNGTDLAIPGDFSPGGKISLAANKGLEIASGAPATTTSKLYQIGSVLYWNGAVVGGASSVFTTWVVDAGPASPDSINDEFNVTNATVDGKWTTINWGTWTIDDVNTTIKGNLYLEVTGATDLTAMLQTIPAGDFTIFAKIMVPVGVNYFGVGLCLSSTNTDLTGKQIFCGMTYSFAFFRKYESWTNWTTQDSTVSFPTFSNYPVGYGVYTYYRIRRSSTSYYAAISDNGIFWDEVQVYPGATPVYFGVYGWASNSFKFCIDFFRYYPSATAQLGDMVTYGYP